MPDLLTTAAHAGPVSVRSVEERLVDVRVVPWDVVGRTAQGPERMRRGVFGRADPGSVTLEAIGPHGAEPGVRLAGVAVALEAREDGQYATFRVSRTQAGDELLALAADGVYRGASAVFEPQTSRVVDGVTERTSARLVRVGIVEQGAYPGAAVLAVRAAPNPEGRSVNETNPPEPTPTPDPPQDPPTGVRVAVSTPDMEARMDALREDVQRRMVALELRSGVPGTPNLMARWASLGAYLADASADPQAAILLARALADQTTADNPGVVPPSYLGEVKGIIDTARPAIASLGGPASLGATGMSLHYPLFAGDLTTLVGKQTPEKTEIVSVKVSFADGSAAIDTFAGGSDISYQLIRRSAPSYLEAYGRIMLSGWALTTEKEFETDLSTLGTGSVTLDPGASDAEIRAAFFAASAAVKRATGAPASVALAASDVFGALGGTLVPPQYGTTNQTGVGSAASLQVNVSGLPVLEAPYLPDGSLIWTNGQAARWHEDGPFVATAEDVARLGQNRAYWSMGASAVYIPAGVVKAAPTVPLGGRSSKSAA